MSAKILISDEFRRNAKKLIKKYRSLKSELKELTEELKSDPTKGKKIAENTYKIRLAVKSKGKGKSGGMRIITYVVIKVDKQDDFSTVILITIYDKSDFDNVSDQYIKSVVDSMLSEEEIEINEENQKEEE